MESERENKPKSPKIFPKTIENEPGRDQATPLAVVRVDGEKLKRLARIRKFMTIRKFPTRFVLVLEWSLTGPRLAPLIRSQLVYGHP
jgi:hypothetical protein